MKDRIQSLRRRYEVFKKGEKNLLSLRDEIHSILEEARKEGDKNVVDRLEDMLMDLEFSIEENKCKCHRKRSVC